VLVDVHENIIYVADCGNHRIRVISLDGKVRTHAGHGVPGLGANLRFPRRLYKGHRGKYICVGIEKERFGVLDFAPYATHPVAATTISTSCIKSGDIIVADPQRNRILAISPERKSRMVAGGEKGFCNGDIESAKFRYPTAVVKAPNGTVYVTDTSNFVIREISLEGNVTTLAGREGERGFRDGEGKEALFDRPCGISIHNNALYVTDRHRIRKVDIKTGTLTTVTGTDSFGYKDGLAHEAMFNHPQGIDVASDGTVYVADTRNNRVRAISADGLYVSTVAGTGVPGFQDGVAVSEAQFHSPVHVLVDDHERIYVADCENHRIRVISPDGMVRTHAGHGVGANIHFPRQLYKGHRGMYVYMGLEKGRIGALDFAPYATEKLAPRQLYIVKKNYDGNETTPDGDAEGGYLEIREGDLLAPLSDEGQGAGASYNRYKDYGFFYFPAKKLRGWAPIEIMEPFDATDKMIKDTYDEEKETDKNSE